MTKKRWVTGGQIVLSVVFAEIIRDSGGDSPLLWAFAGFAWGAVSMTVLLAIEEHLL